MSFGGNRKLSYGSGSIRIEKATGVVRPLPPGKDASYFEPKVGRHMAQFTRNGISYRPEVRLQPLPSDRQIGLARSRQRSYGIRPENAEDQQNFEFLRLNRVSTGGAENPILDERPGPAPRDLFLRNGRGGDPSRLDNAATEQYLRRRERPPTELAGGAPSRGDVAAARERSQRGILAGDRDRRVPPPAPPAPPVPGDAGLPNQFGGVPAAAAEPVPGPDGSVAVGPAVFQPNGGFFSRRRRDDPDGSRPLLTQPVVMGAGGNSGVFVVAKTVDAAANGASNLSARPTAMEIDDAAGQAVALPMDPDRQPGALQMVNSFQGSSGQQGSAEGTVLPTQDMFGAAPQIQQSIIPMVAVPDPASQVFQGQRAIFESIAEAFRRTGNDLVQTQLGGRMHAAVEAVQAGIPVLGAISDSEPLILSIVNDDVREYVAASSAQTGLSIQDADVVTSGNDGMMIVAWQGDAGGAPAVEITTQITQGAIVVYGASSDGMEQAALNELADEAGAAAERWSRAEEGEQPSNGVQLALPVGADGTRQGAKNVAALYVAAGANQTRAQRRARGEGSDDESRAAKRRGPGNNFVDALPPVTSRAARRAQRRKERRQTRFAAPEDAGDLTTRRRRDNDGGEGGAAAAVATSTIPAPPPTAGVKRPVGEGFESSAAKRNRLTVQESSVVPTSALDVVTEVRRRLRDKRRGAVSSRSLQTEGGARFTGFDGDIQALIRENPAGDRVLGINLDGVYVFIGKSSMTNPIEQAAVGEVLRLLHTVAVGTDPAINAAAAAPNSIVTHPSGAPLAVVPRTDVDGDADGPVSYEPPRLGYPQRLAIRAIEEGIEADGQELTAFTGTPSISLEDRVAQQGALSRARVQQARADSYKRGERPGQGMTRGQKDPILLGDAPRVGVARHANLAVRVSARRQATINRAARAESQRVAQRTTRRAVRATARRTAPAA
jgi:hypothetical protein